MRRLIATLIAATLVLGILPVLSFAATATGTVEFYNAETDALIDKLGSESSVKARIAFEAPRSGDASVIAAQYNSKGVLLSTQEVGTISMTEGEEVDYTTPAVSVSGAESMRFFVWNGLNSPVPVLKNPGTISKPETDVSVEVENSNGVVGNGVSITGTNMSADIPEGVALENGATELTLSVENLESSASGIETSENEELTAIDIHIDGIADDNNVPIIVTVEGVAKNGLNNGNISLYHVENGVTNEMTRVESAEELTEHNTYTYDAEKGTLTLAMSSFSEVAVVSDTVNAWEGKVDTSWYNTTDATLKISNADQLAGFAKIVGGIMDGYTRDSFKYKTVKLTADVNLGDKDNANEKLIFHPIGYYYTDDKNADGTNGDYYSTVKSFEGTFDGQGHTIANFYQNTWEIRGDYDGNYYCDAMGLFGYVVDGKIHNLNVDSFSSDGEFTPTGVIAAYAVNSTFENIAITNCNPRVYNTGNGGIIGIAGNSNDQDKQITLKNITIDNTNKISALWGSWDVACGGLVGMFRGNADGGNGKIRFENCHVAAQIDVYNDVCANYQYYAYRYAGMIIGSIRHNTTNDEGKTIPNMAGITATGCTVNYGDWNDYYYCEFEKNSPASYSEDYQFSRVDKSEIIFDEDGKAIGCTHSHTDEEDKKAVYLPFHQLFTGYSWGVSSIGLEKYSGIVTNLDITEGDQNESVEKFETKFTGDFLYRVGSAKDSPVSLGTLFKAKDGVTINNSGVYVSVDKVDESMNVSGTFTANTTDWTKGTIQFSGTGVVKVTIQDYNYCTPTELYLEVVDAYNRTTATFGGNSVLLNDVSTSSTLSTSGVIYGNGFTVNMENAPISEKNGAVFHLYDGAVLKNLGIVGKEFTSVATNVNDTNYGVSAVRAWGTVTIENCYISGCRAPVSVTGTELTIKDSVIANGVYANVDFRSGILNLHNVTTVNEPHTVNGTTVLGLGIVGNMTASAGRQLNITGKLTQYNWVSKTDCNNIKANGVSGIFEGVFTGDEYASLRYTYNGTTYVNTGILSLCSDFGETAVTGVPSVYDGMNVTATISNVSVDGYVWSPAQKGTLSDDDMKYHDTVYEWTPNNQGTAFVSPSFDFSNSVLTVENDVVQVEYESGSSYTLSADIIKSIFNPQKYGTDLSYKVSMNGTDYTNKDIVLNGTKTQTYTITYTITDDIVYDKDGMLTTATYEISKDLMVFATVVEKGADAPTFTFYYGTNGSASAGSPHTTQPTNSYTSTIKQVGEGYYIMPNVSATSANAIGSQTVDGVTVYYPIVDGINVRSGNSTDYDFTRYYPVFKAVKISDNGTEYTYSGTKEMPATVAWVSATIDSGNGASALNDGFGLYNNQYLCKIQKKAGDEEKGGTSVVEYSYTALDGNTYYYYVGYRFYDEDEGGLCVTADTMVTLADGSQKRIDSLSADDILKVWDFENGEYVYMPSAVVRNHGYADNTVITLKFSDGTVTKTVNEHGYFDAEVNDFVAISADTANDYIGHRFIKETENGYTTVILEEISITKEYTEAWSLITVYHFNFITDGMFSISSSVRGLDYFTPFEIGENMTIDEEKMAEDIAKYGLYNYEEFADIVTYEQFIAMNGAHRKVAVGKGIITWEDLMVILEIEVLGDANIKM